MKKSAFTRKMFSLLGMLCLSLLFQNCTSKEFTINSEMILGSGSQDEVSLAVGTPGNSVTYYGVTVHFAETHLVGKFVNGEPWIVGPVTVIGIDKPSVPTTATTTGGAMINPIPEHGQGFSPQYGGLDYDGAHYDSKLDASLKYPFTLKNGDSLIVARAIGPEAANDGGAYYANVDSVMGFIILEKPPLEGSFRPGLYGSDHKVRFNKKDIDYSVLKNLAPVPATPSQEWMEAPYRLPALPWWEWTGDWTGSFIRPLENCGTGLPGSKYRSQYGRETAYKWSQVALWLNTANTQAVKEKTMIQTIQVGLDLASYFENGGHLNASGGHEVGRKFPLLLAAVALKDPSLLAFASNPNLFIEDKSIFFVKQSDVGREVELMKDGGSYIQEDVGLPDWGINHDWNPWKDDRRWVGGIPYRYVQWPAMSGQVLAADLMGLRKVWNHPAIFEYSERHTRQVGLGDSFEKQMWDAYKPAVDLQRVARIAIAPNGGHFNNEQTVTMSTVTAGAKIYYTLDGTNPTSSSILYTGPILVRSSQLIKVMGAKSGIADSDSITEAEFIFP